MGCDNYGNEPPNDGLFGENGATYLLIAGIAAVVLYFIIKLAIENALKDIVEKSPLGNFSGGCNGNGLL